MKKNIGLMIVLIIGFAFVTTGFTVSTSGSEPLTSQIWAVSVSADPGEVGSLTTNFQAAHGSYENVDDEDYVGDYFNIEQQSYVSSGETKRYIDISSPYSHAYLSEDMTVIGMASIRESFSMENFPAGSAATVSWWDLF
ncbi:MAG: hypothetical protein SCJ97_10800 [Bacillota bacterium]|nr:hypothetical protein [Bacillota bacterium]